MRWGENTSRPDTESGSERRGLRVQGSCCFAARLGRKGVTVLLCNQQLAEHMKIATQHAQMKVAAEALLRTVTATRQAVASLQRTDRRFDATGNL